MVQVRGVGGLLLSKEKEGGLWVHLCGHTQVSELTNWCEFWGRG